jgi:hypothetical protein
MGCSVSKTSASHANEATGDFYAVSKVLVHLSRLRPDSIRWPTTLKASRTERHEAREGERESVQISTRPKFDDEQRSRATIIVALSGPTASRDQDFVK